MDDKSRHLETVKTDFWKEVGGDEVSLNELYTLAEPSSSLGHNLRNLLQFVILDGQSQDWVKKTEGGVPIKMTLMEVFEGDYFHFIDYEDAGVETAFGVDRTSFRFSIFRCRCSGVIMKGYAYKNALVKLDVIGQNTYNLIKNWRQIKGLLTRRGITTAMEAQVSNRRDENGFRTYLRLSDEITVHFPPFMRGVDEGFTQTQVWDHTNATSPRFRVRTVSDRSIRVSHTYRLRVTDRCAELVSQAASGILPQGTDLICSMSTDKLKRGWKSEKFDEESLKRRNVVSQVPVSLDRIVNMVVSDEPFGFPEITYCLKESKSWADLEGESAFAQWFKDGLSYALSAERTVMEDPAVSNKKDDVTESFEEDFESFMSSVNMEDVTAQALKTMGRMVEEADPTPSSESALDEEGNPRWDKVVPDMSLFELAESISRPVGYGTGKSFVSRRISSLSSSFIELSKLKVAHAGIKNGKPSRGTRRSYLNFFDVRDVDENED